jgi:hypothetical protein
VANGGVSDGDRVSRHHIETVFARFPTRGARLEHLSPLQLFLHEADLRRLCLILL